MSKFFTVKDARYPMVPVEEWTFEEAQEFQRIAGMPVGRVFEGIADWNVDAYRGVFVVCMQRVNPALSEADLIGVNFISVIQSSQEISEEEEPAPDPPTASPSNGGGNDDATHTSDSDSPSTPDPTGTLAGSQSSA